DRSPVALDENERFRETLTFQRGLRVGQINGNDRAAFIHAQHGCGHVFAADVAVHAARSAVDRCRLAEEAPGEIEQMAAEVGDDEALIRAKSRLVREYVKPGNHVDAAAKWGTNDSIHQ